MSVASELRDLARQIEAVTLESPQSGKALGIVRCCCDHLLCVARLHELGAMQQGLQDRAVD